MRSEEKIYKVLEHFLSLHEADAVVGMIYDTSFTSDDIIEYIEWCDRRYEEDKETDVETWLKETGGNSYGKVA